MRYNDKRNGSGYWDPTAYQAIKNTEKENMEAKVGHVWTVWFGGQEERAVVIAAYKKHCSVLRLAFEPKGDMNLEISTLSGRKYFVNPEFLTYKLENDFIKSVDELTRESWDDLRQELVDVLGLYLGEPEPEPAETPTQLLAEIKIDPNELEAVHIALDHMAAERDALAETVQQQKVENAELATARDLYREEYHKLLEYFFKGAHLEARP